MVRPIFLAIAGALVLGLALSKMVVAPAVAAESGAAAECLPVAAARGAVAAAASGPVVINDGQIMFNLQRRAAALAAHEHVGLAALVAQLERPSCKLTLPAATPEAMAVTELYGRVRPSVLVVGTYYKCTHCPNWHVMAASGYLITASGVAVTNYHVVHAETKGELMVAQTAAGQVLPVKEVLAASAADDVAIIQLDVSGLPAGTRLVPAALSPDAPVGEAVAVISHPDHHFYVMTQGTIARYCTSVDPKSPAATYMQITADFAKGSSGAPVFDSHGCVVGMVASTASVYYDEENGQQKNLQMVFKQCIPAGRILALIRPGQ